MHPILLNLVGSAQAGCALLRTEDLSAMAEDATRIFCQITWKCPHAVQDTLMVHLHAERSHD
jgi:hypothetical protein